MAGRYEEAALTPQTLVSHPPSSLSLQPSYIFHFYLPTAAFCLPQGLWNKLFSTFLLLVPKIVVSLQNQ
jgi:hypothetical protein